MTNEELLDAWPGIRIDQDNAAYFSGLLNQQLLMNRCDDCRAANPCCVPHASGDEPSTLCVNISLVRCSPREWG